MWLSPSSIFHTNRSHSYSSLDLEHTEGKNVALEQRRGIRYAVIGFLTLWSVGLVFASHSVYARARSTSRTYLYTPLENSIEYEIRTFNQGLWGDHTPYMGSPNATNRAAWHALRRLGIVKLSPEQASRIPGPHSIPYEGYPDTWQGGIEMFHQLHCLYHLRMLIYAKEPAVFYGRDSTVDEEAAHADHCIDHLRQAIMCAGSAEIITFRKDAKSRIVPNFDGPKVCRKFEPLAKWAEENKAWNNTPDGPEEYIDEF